MENMDFPAAVDEIAAIQKKCEKLRQDAAEIAQRTDRVSTFLCSLIGRVPEKKQDHNQSIGSTKSTVHKESWKDAIINDLKLNGKSYTVDILERLSVKRNITGDEAKQKAINIIRTLLARFRADGLVKGIKDGEKIIWEAI